jgi:hypothetical protein
MADKPIVNNEFDVEDASVLCPDCGTRVADKNRLTYHEKTCPAKVKAQSTMKVDTARTNTAKSAPTKSTPTKAPEPAKKQDDPKKILIAQRTAKWGASIYNDVNPVVYTMAKAYVQVPDEWCEGVIGQFQQPDGKVVTLWDPPLKKRLQFSEGDCERIAKAMATFSVSPTGMFVAAWIENNAGLLALGAAGIVAAKFGWNMAKTKAEVAQIKQVMEQQQQVKTGQSDTKESPRSTAA